MPRVAIVRDALARRYNLSRQVATMLALLVVYPIVTPAIMATRIGAVDQSNMISRLRARLRRRDEALLAASIGNIWGQGYIMNDEMRLLLAEYAQFPSPVEQLLQSVTGG